MPSISPKTHAATHSSCDEYSPTGKVQNPPDVPWCCHIRLLLWLGRKVRSNSGLYIYSRPGCQRCTAGFRIPQNGIVSAASSRTEKLERASILRSRPWSGVHVAMDTPMSRSDGAGISSVARPSSGPEIFSPSIWVHPSILQGWWDWTEHSAASLASGDWALPTQVQPKPNRAVP